MEPSHDERGPIPLLLKTSNVLPPSRSVLEAPVRLISLPTPSIPPKIAALVQPAHVLPVFIPPPAAVQPASTPPEPIFKSTPAMTPPPMPAINRPILAPAVFEAKPGRKMEHKRSISTGTMLTITFIVLAAFITFLYLWGARLEQERIVEEAALVE